jgi:hypothetical protein
MCLERQPPNVRHTQNMRQVLTAGSAGAGAAKHGASTRIPGPRKVICAIAIAAQRSSREKSLTPIHEVSTATPRYKARDAKVIYAAKASEEPQAKTPAPARACPSRTAAAARASCGGLLESRAPSPLVRAKGLVVVNYAVAVVVLALPAVIGHEVRAERPAERRGQGRVCVVGGLYALARQASPSSTSRPGRRGWAVQSR